MQVRTHRLLYGVCLLILILPGFGQSQERAPVATLASQPLAQPGEKPAAAGDAYEANDFYYHHGTRVALLRSLTECVVQFRADIARQTRDAVVASVVAAGRISSEKQHGERRFSVVTLRAPADRTAIEGAIAALKARQEVEFAFPVLIFPQTATRLFLTDEIVVKLKPGRRLEDLVHAYGASPVTVVQQVRGTVDEYVLRLQEPKTTHPLAVANAFVDSGMVEWATPNVVQEYRQSFRMLR
jgi:hypothetical protein